MGKPKRVRRIACLKVVTREGTHVAVADLLALPGAWRLRQLLVRYRRRAVPR
jgi:hypothetical protein